MRYAIQYPNGSYMSENVENNPMEVTIQAGVTTVEKAKKFEHDQFGLCQNVATSLDFLFKMKTCIVQTW